MTASLKSELRKIWTVRSTYVVLLFALVLLGFFAFYTEGIKAGVNSKAITDPTKLADLIKAAISNLGTFGALVGILSFSHEYRYNTIMHTLTSSNSRTRSLFAKVTAVSIFAVSFTVFVTIIAVAFMYLGLAIKGLTLSHQIIPGDLLWRTLFVGWGFSMFGLVLASLIRQQVGAIAAFFLVPSLGEALAGLLLKDNRIYLPFSALQQVLQQLENPGGKHVLAPSHAALVVCVYLVIGWAAAWILFLRRDAN